MTQEERDNRDENTGTDTTGGEEKGEHRGDKANQGEGQDTTEEERQRQYLEEHGGE